MANLELEQVAVAYRIPILDTQELVSNMPDNSWVVPPPYEPTDTLDSMQRKVDKFFESWVSLLMAAERGANLSDNMANHLRPTADSNAVQAFLVLSQIQELNGEDIHDQVVSAIRGFASIASRDFIAAFSLDRVMQNGFEERDIANARTVIEYFASSYLGE